MAVAAGAALLAAAPASAAFTPGSAGLGDPFFPRAGNGGYQAIHYDLDLDYRPATGRLAATARIRARATQDLSRFDLDFRGMRVEELTVDGAPAGFTRQGQELVITPAAGIPTGSRFLVRVSYVGRPHAITDPDGSMEGWVPTDDGAFVVGEPQGSPGWFPCNDYPTDKATYDISVTVPNGTEAIANGVLQRPLPSSKRRGPDTWSYSVNQPMATYLATATVGQFNIDRSPLAGLDSLIAIDPQLQSFTRRMRRSVDRTGDMVEFFEGLFGPYPFDSVGAIVDDAPQVGYALETQTRPIYDRVPGDTTVAHEIAHQWFGDSVTPRQWPDLWLNEGFATWAEWRWDQEAGGQTTAQVFAGLQAQPPTRDDLWEPPPAAIPGPAELFSTSVYVRGAMALEALRQQVGNATFLGILRSWAADHRYSNATTANFIALAEASSGQQLDALFQRYLFKPGKP